MSLLTIPNVFVDGTGPTNIIDAVQMNANFTAVETAVNNIYPSQLLPTTTAQATFGATGTGVGYKFLANDATAVPLTIAGVTSQSADIFDVTLTSGGTKVLSVAAGGGLTFGGGITPVASAVQMYNDNGSTNGLSFNIPTGSTNGFRFLVNGTSQLSISATGVLSSLNAVIPGVAGSPGTAAFYSGSGAPSFSAPNGSLYLRYDGNGATSTTLYTNTSGPSSSGTTWTAIAIP